MLIALNCAERENEAIFRNALCGNERRTWVRYVATTNQMRTFNMNLSWISNIFSILFLAASINTLFTSQLSAHGGNLTRWRLSIYPASKSSSKASGPSGSGIVYPMVTAPVSDNHSESEISHGGWWELERQPLVFFLTPKQSLASRAEAVVGNALEIRSFLWSDWQIWALFNAYLGVFALQTPILDKLIHIRLMSLTTVVGWWTCHCYDASGGLCPW